ncbi:MAG TPA: lactonase family protein [Ktedonobacteraceae bacterium]
MVNGQHYLAVGSYASKEEPGISIYAFDPQTALLTFVNSFTGVENPSFLTIDERRSSLYTVSETMTFADEQGGSVMAFALDARTGQLTPYNRLPTHGEFPCHLTLDSTGSWLLVANYIGGNINLFRVLANGEIGAQADNVQHSGQGPRADRQERAHPHSATLDSSEVYAIVPDLGLDTIFIYKLDTSAGRLVPHAETKIEPGSGPRHFVFHPSEQRYAYVINELNGTVTAFIFDAEQGSLQPIQTISTLPADFTAENNCADIHISPDGAFLYASNRGHDSIAVFRVHLEDGTLSFVEHVSTQGKTPRNFTLSPDGRFLFAANQDTNSIVSYSIDATTGCLTLLPERTFSTLHPVCLKFFSIA